MTFPNSKFVVVTGTDTGVGKTIATAALVVALEERGLTVAVAKPVQTGIATGEPTDLEEVARLTGSIAIHEFTRLTPPLAPVAAARIDKVDLPPLDTYVDGIREIDADVVLIEGAGGLLVHLDGNDQTILDRATELAADVVVVGSEGLGSLNHFALTVERLGSAGIQPLLVIGSCAPEPDLASISNLTDLPQVTGLPTTGRIPAAAGVLPLGDFRAQAPSWFTFQ